MRVRGPDAVFLGMWRVRENEFANTLVLLIDQSASKLAHHEGVHHQVEAMLEMLPEAVE